MPVVKHDAPPSSHAAVIGSTQRVRAQRDQLLDRDADADADQLEGRVPHDLGDDELADDAGAPDHDALGCHRSKASLT